MAREMKDSGIQWIGEIPKSWITTKIKNLPNNEENSYIDGDWIESPYITDNGIRYLTTGNIGDGHYKEQGDGYISEDTFVALKCKYAYPGDLVFSRLNEPYGRSCILPNFHPKYVLAVDNVILRTNENKSYICYVSQCKGFQNSVLDMARGTTMKRISRVNLGSVIIPLPSNKEQNRIASFLDSKCAEIDKAIEATKASIEEYKKLRQAIITEAVTKGLDPNVEMKDSGIEWIGEIPHDWKDSKIGQLYSERKEKVSDRDYEPLSVTMQGIVPQLSTAAKSDAHDDRKLVRKGDFAINSRSDRRGSCGISDYDGSVSLINTILKPRESMNPEYYNWLFHTTMFADEFYKWGHGIVDDLWTTNWSEMKSICIPTPPLFEQHRIASYLDSKCAEIDSLIKSKEKLIEELTAYRKSLIYEYVTGKKEVPIESA